ncbi:SusD/RagB family nutrient-binding outer membrane lipoprotein [uncultured Bacteroides sp.]|jgi:hypothetical protein|uniref:SusD/RagB family nutrient-binding outer membrane lipoprotein n=1 Tax=uncultured Bacteroides sp. TaxID=162156 RepID=UPI0025FA619D|nr:SusD/RagB family nutrient-binding outer membrane lipoprotein [uncultured Bacteroides sp.]
MKQILNTFIIGSLLVATASSCTAKFEDINSNPYQPGDLSADDYALGSAMNNLAGCVVSPDVNTAQFTDCLLGGPLGGYFAHSQSNWKATISNFNPTDDWTRVFLKSDRVLPVLYSNLNVVEVVSQNSNNPLPLAIANVIKVAAMHRVADAYGPIPYSKIGADGSIKTPYDSEQEVYNKFFEELNAAIQVMKNQENDRLTASADYIYGGDVKKWIRFANSLKLRLAIRIANVDKTTAQKMAEEAVDPANGGVIEQNADNAAWSYFSSSVNNPIYVAKEYNHVLSHSTDGLACLTGGDTHASADIICYMNGYNDPRREKYFVKSEWVGQEYVGLRRGIIIPDLNTIGHKYSGINLKPTDPLYWMNAAEVAFLRAEAKAIYGFNMHGEAKKFYEDGIRLSFEQWGVDGVDAYINSEEMESMSYTDPASLNSYPDELTSLTVKWDESATPEEKQERIIIQKWIANWMLGNEAWADYRRTGYPHLMPATAAGNKSGGVVNSERGARRIPYPVDEYNDNTENIQYAVSNYLGGQDNMARDLWWAKKN